MRTIDAAAIETIGIPRLLLMEHAGHAVARCVKTILPTPCQPLLFCCGTGLNGGDGLAAARHLHEWGYRLWITVTGRLEQLREEPAIYARILQRLGVPLTELVESSADTMIQAERWMATCGLIIDALVGIGTHGPIREPIATLIACMNQSRKPIIAVDLPSGLDGDTGRVQGVAVKATATVTFGLPKLGCFLAQGPAHVGSLVVESITIPRTLLEVS